MHDFKLDSRKIRYMHICTRGEKLPFYFELFMAKQLLILVHATHKAIAKM